MITLIIILCIIGLVLLIILFIFSSKLINKTKYMIKSKEGIQESGYVKINDIELFVHIKGENIDNPVIIMLHGGPGNTMGYYSYFWQKDLEKSYTIVHYDQRGCGKTYYRNKKAQKPTLELLLSDLDGVIDYVCHKVNKDKVIVFGHSWGTFLGSVYSLKNASKLLAYIGLGQMIDFKESEKVSALEAIRFASKKKAERIKKMLEEIMAYEKFDKKIAFKFLKFRKLKDKYLPKGKTKSLIKTLLLYFTSPDMTIKDLKWLFSISKMIEENSEIYDFLLSKDKTSIYNYGTNYDIPVTIMAGDCDWITPYTMAYDYYCKLSAPKKEFVKIENIGHVPFVDNSKQFTRILLESLSKIGDE